MKTKYSIIIPVYNAQDYIVSCLESFIAQSNKSYEIILVDDGSTDNSLFICKKYANEYPFIRVFHHKNHGPYYARMVGYQHAHGDYCVCIDSDDFVSTDFFYVLDKYVKQYNPDIIVYRICKFINNKVFDHKYSLGIEKAKTINRDELVNKVLKHEIPNGLCCKLVKRSLIKNNKEKMNKKLNMGEDLLMFIPQIEKARIILLIPNTLYYYRYNPKSLTNTYNDMLPYSIDVLNEELFKIIDIWNINDGENLVYSRYIRDIVDVFSYASKTEEFGNIKSMITYYKNSILFKKALNNSIKNIKFSEKILIESINSENMLILLIAYKINILKNKIRNLIII